MIDIEVMLGYGVRVIVYWIVLFWWKERDEVGYVFDSINFDNYKEVVFIWDF